MVRLSLLVAGIVVSCSIERSSITWFEAEPAAWGNVMAGFSFSLVALLGLAVALIDGTPVKAETETRSFGEVHSGGELFRCPICGASDNGPRMVCGSCETPHHVECARWAGGCSRYGCGLSLSRS